MKSTNDLLPEEQIAIDGKTLRRSHDRNIKQKAIVMVSAFSRQKELVLAQEKVNKKSNEITAVPKLLKVLKLSGAIVSLDAMGCQRKIANQIVEQKADYLIALKNNQPGLYERVNKLFQSVLFQDKVDFNLSSHTGILNQGLFIVDLKFYISEKIYKSIFSTITYFLHSKKIN